MGTMHATTCIFSLFLILNFFSPSISASKDTICNNTPFPNFCKSILPNNNSASIHDHGQFSVQQSISTTKKLLSLVNNYLKLQQALPENIIRVLEDCQLLCNLNIDFLSTTLQTIGTKDTIERLKADDLLTFLSATLTNQQTCLGELEALTSISTLKSSLKPLLSDGNMFYSVSLAIFKHGWVQNTREGIIMEEKPDKKPSDIKLYEGGNNVKVMDKVVVNPNGSGNFTNINDAVAAAPNNTDGTKGYFVIYVAAGVYEEYVNISNSKKYLMMIGEGINKTIVTGNRSVADGWTTFNTATLSKLLYINTIFIFMYFSTYITLYSFL